MPTSPTGCATRARRPATARPKAKAAALARPRCSARRSAAKPIRPKVSNSGVARRASNIARFAQLDRTTADPRRSQRAHDSTARPQRTPDKIGAGQGPRAQGLTPAPRRVHAGLHAHPEEAELGAAQGRPGAADHRDGGHRLHPRRRPQPPGALDRARARRPRPRPSRRPLQDRAGRARRRRRRRPPPGPQPVRRQARGIGMPRKGAAPRRDLMPDPIHRSVVVTQFVNKLLQRGKRSLSERIVYDALGEIERKTGSEPVGTVKRAVENVRPALEVKSRRVGGATYQVPVEVRPRRATTLAIRWIVGYARQRREKTMSERLAAELMDAGNGIGAAIKRKDDMQKMAESNRAFAHYRW